MTSQSRNLNERSRSCSKEGWRGATRTAPCPPMAAARKSVRSAEFGARVAEHQLTLAQTALMQLSGQGEEGEQLDIISPVAGQVLKIFQESEGVAQGGTDHPRSG